jgi:hypothetical protein
MPTTKQQNRHISLWATRFRQELSVKFIIVAAVVLLGFATAAAAVVVTIVPVLIVQCNNC